MAFDVVQPNMKAGHECDVFSQLPVNIPVSFGRWVSPSLHLMILSIV